jgi:glutamine amidotransferase
MCRHFAYLGPVVPLAHLMLAPPYGLMEQSYRPRRQRYGHVNVDGFGVGWYPSGEAQPVRYRRAVPIWTDANLPQVLCTVHTGAAMGAVRSATPGMAGNEEAAAPFTAGPWLFSHNGVLPGWPAPADELAAGVPVSRLLAEGAATDSTLLWALLRHRLEAGAHPVAAVAELTARARRIPGARVNLLLHTGTEIVATAAGDSLCHLTGEHPDPAGNPTRGVIVASEPFDDADGWVEVPDDSLVHVTATDLTVHQLTEFAPTDRPLAEVP